MAQSNLKISNRTVISESGRTHQAKGATEEQTTDPAQETETRPETESQPAKGSGSDEPDSAVAEETDAGYELPLDQLFEILKNSRRRQTLHFLQENEGVTTLSDLAEDIAAKENNTTVRQISSSQRKRVYVGLYQCHLPKMDDMDIIDFDQNRGTVETGPNAEQLRQYITEPVEREWHKLYMGVTIAGAGLFAISQLGAAAYGLTATIVLFGVLGGIFACSLVHALHMSR